MFCSPAIMTTIGRPKFQALSSTITIGANWGLPNQLGPVIPMRPSIRLAMPKSLLNTHSHSKAIGTPPITAGR